MSWNVTSRTLIGTYLNLCFFLINSRCTCIAWVPGGDGAFVVSHADGNLYVYEKASPNHQQRILFYSSLMMIFLMAS